MKIQLISNDTVKTIEKTTEKTYEHFIRRIEYETELFLSTLFNENTRPILNISIQFTNMRANRTLLPNYFANIELLTDSQADMAKIKARIINEWIKKELELSGAKYFFEDGTEFIGKKVIDPYGNISKIVKNIEDTHFILENEIGESCIVDLAYVLEHVYTDEEDCK